MRRVGARAPIPDTRCRPADNSGTGALPAPQPAGARRGAVKLDELLSGGASWGSLSSRQRPVNQKPHRQPSVILELPQPAVWFGDSVSSAPSTSRTRLGSNHTSAGTRVDPGGRCVRDQRLQPRRQRGSSASENPVPHLPTV